MRRVISGAGMVLMLLPVLLMARSERLHVSAFAVGNLEGWEERSFLGETRYDTARLEGRPVLRASSDGSASLLVKELDVDLGDTPYLNWSWRVSSPLQGLAERSRAGDDFAARVYVVVKDGLLPWSYKAVTYVWSGSEPKGASWPSAFTERAVMVAVRGQGSESDSWHEEKRNVREDFANFFGEEVGRVHAVAIMTDTDNSGLSAEAFYGDIYFSQD